MLSVRFKHYQSLLRILVNYMLLLTMLLFMMMMLMMLLMMLLTLMMLLLMMLLMMMMTLFLFVLFLYQGGSIRRQCQRLKGKTRTCKRLERVIDYRTKKGESENVVSATK